MNLAQELPVLMLLRSLLVGLQPYLVPVCAVFAWLLMVLIAASLWGAMRDSVRRSQQLHRIPCARCQYFTGDYRLKCTVHPHLALTEEAIGCPDQRPCQSPFTMSQSRMP